MSDLMTLHEGDALPGGWKIDSVRYSPQADCNCFKAGGSWWFPGEGTALWEVFAVQAPPVKSVTLHLKENNSE